MFNEGIYADLDDEIYHADHTSISRSTIMEFKRSPYHYWARYLNDKKPKVEMTDAMLFGKAFHMMVLETHKFAEHFAVLPERVLLKDVGREAYDEYKFKCEEIENSNKHVLSLDEFKTILDMEFSLVKDKQIHELIVDAKYEQSYFWKDGHTGLMCKARPDIVHENMIVDLKTCVDASPRAMSYAMRDGGYHIQAAMIRDAIWKLQGKQIDTFILLCIEKKYPYAIATYIISEDAIEIGKQQYKQTLIDINHASTYNDYHSYSTQELFLP